MGYTTNFTGKFDFSKELTMAQYNELMEFSEVLHEDTDGVTGYCQWQPTRDGKSLEWDGGEKFYNYVEWLQYLIVRFFKPWGIELSGEIEYQGEEVGDVGKLVIEDGKVKQIEYKAPEGVINCPHCGERIDLNEQ